jgi:hypothetical protein
MQKEPSLTKMKRKSPELVQMGENSKSSRWAIKQNENDGVHAILSKKRIWLRI